MQYCQLQHIIKILLLNGLFVLFSHAMEQTVLTNIDVTNLGFFEDMFACSACSACSNCSTCSDWSAFINPNYYKSPQDQERKKKSCVQFMRLSAQEFGSNLKRAINGVIKKTGADGEICKGLKNAAKKRKATPDNLETNKKRKIPTIDLRCRDESFTTNISQTINTENYLDVLHEVFEQAKTIAIMKKELKKSNAIHSELYRCICILEKKTIPLEVALVKSQIEKDELQKQYSELQKLHENSFTLDFKEQNSKLFPNSGY